MTIKNISKYVWTKALDHEIGRGAGGRKRFDRRPQKRTGNRSSRLHASSCRVRRRRRRRRRIFTRATSSALSARVCEEE